MKAEMTALEARKITLTDQLSTAEDPEPLLHPSMAKRYQEKLTELYDAFGSDNTRNKAAAAIRPLIEKVTITPKDNVFHITLIGDFAQLISFSSHKQNPASANLVKSMTYDNSQSGVSVGCGGRI